MTPLYVEINRWMGKPFIWGETDCALAVCDWVHAIKGVDPAEDIRGLYDDRLSCHRLTGWLREPVKAFERGMAKAGCPRVDEPSEGDVAVVMAPGERDAVCALFLGDCWAIKGPNGATTINKVQVLAAWGVGYA